MAAKKLAAAETAAVAEILDKYTCMKYSEFAKRTTLGLSTVKRMIANEEIETRIVKAGKRPRRGIPVSEFVRYMESLNESE